MEIDIADFVSCADPYEFSASLAERGATWNNAKREAASAPLLTTPEQLDALRDHVRGFGAWDDEEIAAWSAVECNALLIQMISNDMCEAGPDKFDRDSCNLYRGDDGRIYYRLGD